MYEIDISLYGGVRSKCPFGERRDWLDAILIQHQLSNFPCLFAKGKTFILFSAPNQALMHSYNLSKREIEIANLVVQGISNFEISQMLFINENTVKQHMSKIYKKCKVSSRWQLMATFSQ